MGKLSKKKTWQKRQEKKRLEREKYLARRDKIQILLRKKFANLFQTEPAEATQATARARFWLFPIDVEDLIAEEQALRQKLRDILGRKIEI